MRHPPAIRLLPDGRRLHLQDGPIDLVVQAWGPAAAVRLAYAAAARTFGTVLDTLCTELPALRRPSAPGDPAPHGPVARAMAKAVAPLAREGFITPMAAVAGAVADHVLAAMLAAADLPRAFVNNGGDIALHCGPGQCLTAGLVDRPDTPTLYDALTIAAADGVGGIAARGWRGRSFSRGIADAVTVLGRSAAAADAAATVIANAVDLPGHPAVRRVPADSLQPDSDLGALPVTRDVAILHGADRGLALARGLDCAEGLLARGLIAGAVLCLQGEVRSLGLAQPCGRGPAPALPGSIPFGLAAHG